MPLYAVSVARDFAYVRDPKAEYSAVYPGKDARGRWLTDAIAKSFDIDVKPFRDIVLSGRARHNGLSVGQVGESMSFHVMIANSQRVSVTVSY